MQYEGTYAFIIEFTWRASSTTPLFGHVAGYVISWRVGTG